MYSVFHFIKKCKNSVKMARTTNKFNDVADYMSALDHIEDFDREEDAGSIRKIESIRETTREFTDEEFQTQIIGNECRIEVGLGTAIDIGKLVVNIPFKVTTTNASTQGINQVLALRAIAADNYKTLPQLREGAAPFHNLCSEARIISEDNIYGVMPDFMFSRVDVSIDSNVIATFPENEKTVMTYRNGYVRHIMIHGVTDGDCRPKPLGYDETSLFISDPSQTDVNSFWNSAVRKNFKLYPMNVAR